MFGTIQTFLPGTASRQYPALLWDIQCLSCSTGSVYGSAMNAMMTNKGHYKIACLLKKTIVLAYCAEFILILCKHTNKRSHRARNRKCTFKVYDMVRIMFASGNYLSIIIQIYIHIFAFAFVFATYTLSINLSYSL